MTQRGYLLNFDANGPTVTGADGISSGGATLSIGPLGNSLKGAGDPAQATLTFEPVAKLAPIHDVDERDDEREKQARDVLELRQRIDELERTIRTRNADVIGRHDPFPLVFPAQHNSLTNWAEVSAATDAMAMSVADTSRGGGTSTQDALRSLMPPLTMALEVPEMGRTWYMDFGARHLLTYVGGGTTNGGMYNGSMQPGIREDTFLDGSNNASITDNGWNLIYTGTNSTNNCIIINSDEFGLNSHRLGEQWRLGRWVGMTVDGTNRTPVVLIDGGKAVDTYVGDLDANEALIWDRDNPTSDDGSTPQPDGGTAALFTIINAGSLALSYDVGMSNMTISALYRQCKVDANGYLKLIGPTNSCGNNVNLY